MPCPDKLQEVVDPLGPQPGGGIESLEEPVDWEGAAMS